MKNRAHRPEVEQLRRLIAEGIQQQIAPALDGVLSRLLEHEDDGYSDDALQHVVDDLMNGRFLPEAARFLEGLTVAGRKRPINDIASAQILIETDRLSAAIPMLDHLAATHRDDPVLFAEAKGLAGRAQKELFLRALSGNRRAAQTHLAKAIQRYDEGRNGDPAKRNWMIGNMLALRAKGARNEMDVDDLFDVDLVAAELDAAIEAVPREQREFYQWSSQAEARFARRDWSGAVTSVDGMLRATDGDVFKLTSTLRQYKNVWHLDEAGPEAGLIVSAIERRLLDQPNGRVVLDRRDIARQRTLDENQLEAVFGDALMRGQSWMRKFLDLGSCVAVVVDRHSGRVKGTCCLVNGGDLDPSLDGRALCLTNDHVISEQPEPYELNTPLAPGNASVRFTLSDEPEREYDVGSVIWSSPYEAHDTCLFELAEPPPFERSKLVPVRRLPPAPADPAANVFVISHPNADEPSYSFQNTSLLMHDAKTRGDATLEPGYLHYSTGTVKGSSGGVALNGRLGMIGLHHAGGSEIRRIDGTPGVHAANEAIWITAIINALRNDLAAGRRRWSFSDNTATG